MIEVIYNFSDKDVRKEYFTNFSDLKFNFKLIDTMSKNLDKQGLSHGIPLAYLVIKIIEHKEKKNEKN